MYSLCSMLACSLLIGSGTTPSSPGTSGQRPGRSLAKSPICTSPRIPSFPMGNMVTDSTSNQSDVGMSFRWATPCVIM